MENLISRYRNVTILVAILFAQVLGLAVQVKRRSGDDESTRLIRLWTVSADHSFRKGHRLVPERHWAACGTTTSTCAACGRRIAT